MSQTDVLNDFWRMSTPINLSAYNDSYRMSFPVNEKSEDILKVSSDLTTFLRLFSFKLYLTDLSHCSYTFKGDREI